MSDTKPKATILDLDALMDTNMDKVETLPDYITPPPGLYVLDVVEAKTEKFEMKETKQVAQRIRITYKIAETKSVKTGEQPVPDGSLFSESFMGTEEGIKYFKKAAMNILSVTDFEGAKLGDVMEGLKGAQFEAAITIRTTKNDAGKEFENINIRAAKPTVE